MSELTDRLHLEEMIEAARNIAHDTAGFDLEMFKRISTHRDAVAMNLIVLGEGAARLSLELKQQAPDVPWGDMAGVRNRLAHGYARTDPGVIFDAATVFLPLIVPELRRLLTLLPPEQD